MLPPEHHQVLMAEALKGAPHEGLPSLENSDFSFDEALNQLIGKSRFMSMFISKDIIRKIVVTVDNATGRQLPLDSIPFKPLEGHFKIIKMNGSCFTRPDSDLRYLPYVHLIQNINLKKLESTYVYFYPLFQSAYSELGTKGYFNDRLVEVIDNALATPMVNTQIKLLQPSVYYQFEDAKFEELSAIQKILIRIGPDYAKQVKARLLELRELLIHLNH